MHCIANPTFAGSSPLARGTHPNSLSDHLWGGLIPARAGNTMTFSMRCAPSGAHPRSRGEHMTETTLKLTEAGSSPLARGTRALRCSFGGLSGLIPARAGNTLVRTLFTRRSWAHPRSRGEHGTGCSAPSSVEGSSPLARGTRHLRRLRLRHIRLIPARAGNTCSCTRGRNGSWAHPRSRGEHNNDQAIITKLAGSSPLARGTLIPGGYALPGGGLIPARAGNTSPRLHRRTTFGAHPRSRGEHVLQRPGRLRRGGSSPLARGTPRDNSTEALKIGLIPARAGNTRWWRA